MIGEKDINNAMRRLNRLNFQDKEALAEYQREKLQQYFRQQLANNLYYRPWLGKPSSLIPMMDTRGIAQNFSTLCTVPALDYHRLFAEGMRIHARGGDWHKEAEYFTFMQSVRHSGWKLQVYDKK